MSNKVYNCTQRELYAVCASGWENCNQNLEKFTSFRPLYTAAFIESMLKGVATVSAMPHRTSRSAEQDFARIELKDKLAECHGAWKKLKLAIPGLFPANQREAHYKAIGQDFYADSQRFKWEACTGLMETALAYVQKHAALLQASPMLGAGFAEEFGTLTGDLHSKLQKYLTSIKEYGKGGEAKVKASNELYAKLMLMFADAKIIFRNDPETLKHFTFDFQLDLVSGQNAAGIKGMISNGQVPVDQIRDLMLSLAENGDEAFIAGDGSFRFSQLAAGTYTLLVKATGYKEQSIPNIAVNTGSFSTVNITLEPVGPDEAAGEKV